MFLDSIVRIILEGGKGEESSHFQLRFTGHSMSNTILCEPKPVSGMTRLLHSKEAKRSEKKI